MIEPRVYLVSVPIGNHGDISSRAVEMLQSCDLLIAEEHKPAYRLLNAIGIKREYELLNEHSRRDDIDELMDKIRNSRLTCVISDAGTPVLEDPGSDLVSRILQEKIYLGVVPGADAVTSALVLSGFPVVPYTFFGFLNVDKNIRKKEIHNILSCGHTAVLYETPYRYKALLKELHAQKKNLDIFLALDLTTEQEFQFRGKIGNLVKILDKLPKAPPVIVLDLTYYRKAEKS